MKRLIKRREALAIWPEALQSDHRAAWWDQAVEIPETYACGDVQVVSVRGSLDHHVSSDGDSYEAILARAAKAFAESPSHVVLRIDSPGGVVSGLNEAVFALQRMSAECGIPLIAYVDELCASAAYALACSCEEIVLPASAITGSVGVISAMCDQVAADKKAGINFVTITSGDRKADGHPHVPVTDAAIQAETRRVTQLASQFFQIVADARGISTSKVASLEAGIFLGKEAVKVGLADAVMSWDDLLSHLSATEPGGESTKKPLARSGTSGTQSLAHARPNMSLALKQLLTKAKAGLAKAKDPKVKKTLTAAISQYEAALEAYKRVKKTVKYEAESDEGDEEDEAAEEESEEAKGNETDRKEGDDPPPSDDDEDDEEDEEEEDEEEESEESEEEEEAAAKSPRSAHAVLALAQQATGKKGKHALGALAAMIAEGKRAAAEVAQIRKERNAEKKANAITSALNAHRITRKEAKDLRGKPLSFVASFLEMRPKAIFNASEDELLTPSERHDGAISGEVDAEISRAMSVFGEGKTAAEQKTMREELIKAHRARMNGSNGAGRY